MPHFAFIILTYEIFPVNYKSYLSFGERCREKLTFLERKVSQRNSHWIYHFILAEAFEIPKDFSRKVLCVGVWGEATTDNEHKKHGIAVLFLFGEKYFYIEFSVFIFC